ncbi:MAG: hypothetical protein HDR01_12245 [Lachnospiraceae bacterium]|nr:hypothetical protein [Lachnospiraceae bacterium]
MFDDLFKRKKLIPDKLPGYGFRMGNGIWLYETDIMNGNFSLIVSITESGRIDTSVIEKENGEEYVLYKTNASGTFVGEVRTAIESVLNDIIVACFETAVFKTEQAQKIIEYVRKTYGDELEFLWEKFPDNAVWRRKDNKKWYGAILSVQKNRLGFASAEFVEIIDLRLQPELMEDLVLREHYYPGWHMNKKRWYTIILDGSIPDEELFQRIGTSYELAKK